MTNVPNIETTATIRKYNEVVMYILSEYRKKFGKDLINSQAKASINKGLAVKSRLVIDPLHEQVGFFSLPVLQGLDG
jgi:hypothetical protein